MELNIVTCGHCGEVFGHKLGVHELHCPYCKYEDDVSGFPDLYYPPEHADSLIDVERDKDYFVITRLHRDDFKARGYNADELTDQEMQRIASKMGDAYVEHMYWDGIDFWAKEMNLPEEKDWALA